MSLVQNLLSSYGKADFMPVFEDKKYSEEANRAAVKAAGNTELDVRDNGSNERVEGGGSGIEWHGLGDTAKGRSHSK